MKPLRSLLLLTLMVALTACGGKGSSAPAPANFKVQAQDSQLHLSWDALPGVEYWVWCTPNASVVTHPSASGTFIFQGFKPGKSGPVDYYATSLTNGTPYACAVNGRYDGGPGGPDAASQVATPKLVGSTGSESSWSAGATMALSGMTLKSVAYGPLTALNTLSDQFVAVGRNGQIATSTSVAADATLVWAAPTQTTDVATDLNAVTFYPWTSGYRFVAVGAAGRVVYATNASTWTWASTTTPMPAGASVVPDLNAIAPASLNAAAATSGGLVAVGNAGYVATSSDGVNWNTPVTVPTQRNLRAVVFVPASTSTASYWVAVGDAGTVIKSMDGGLNWTALSAGSQNLKSVSVLPALDANQQVVSNILVAAGDQGLVYSSNGGVSWASVSGVMPSAGGFVSVINGRGGYTAVSSSGLMAVDAAGLVYTSLNGTNWNGPVFSGVSSPVALVRYAYAVNLDYKWLSSQNLPQVSHGWIVFDSSGNQRIAR